MRLLDINQHVVRNPVATFYVEADTGTSVVEFGIFPGDTLVVDRSLTARHGDIVMVCWEGGFTVKQLRLRAGRYELVFAAGDYFRAHGMALSDPPFLDEIVLRFAVADASAHYHVPLLASPWSYATYRGS